MSARHSSRRFLECLPEGCPPPDADEIKDVKVVYRLVRTDPPTDSDFRSQRAENPDKRFNTSECRARGLSVFSRIKDAENVLKLPTRRKMRICQVTLVNGAGFIQKTGRGSHFTWWPLADFDILSSCWMLDQ